MATFEDIMRGLKSQEGDDKKVEFSDALLGQQGYAGATNMAGIGQMQGVPYGGTLDAETGAKQLRIGDQWNRGGAVNLSDMRYLDSQLFPSNSITAQVPGIENITLGQAPIVSQEGMQYQPSYDRPIMSAGTVERSDLNVRPDGTYTSQATPFQVLGAGFADALDAIRTDKVSIDDYRAEQAKAQMQTGQQAEQVTPTIQSITEVEQAKGLPPTQLEALEKLSPQPEATTTPPFEGSRLTTVGGASLSEFLGGAAMPEQGFARAERQMAGRGTTLTPEQFNELSAQREARIGGGGETATERDTRRAEARVTNSQNIPTDVREAMNTPAGRLTRDQIKRLTDWQGSTQGQAYMAEQEAAEAEANKPFEPKEVEIGGNKYIQFGPKDYRRVEEPKAPKKSEIESIREEGVKAGLPENLIRQSIASKLGLDIYDEGVMNWMAGNTDTMPSVEGASESSAPISKTIPTITSQEEYDALESGQTYIDSQGIRAVKK